MSAHKDVETLKKSVARNSWIVTILLVVIAIQVVSFGIILYNLYAFAQRMTKPETLLNMAESRLRNNYPAIREKMKSNIIQSAPEIAKRLSNQTKEGIPYARNRLQKFAIRQLDYGLKKAKFIGVKEFREFVEENETLVRDGLQEVKEVPQETRKYVVQVENALEKTFGTSIQSHAQQVLAVHDVFNDHLKYLLTHRPLDEENRYEVRLIRVWRTMEQQEISTKK